MPRVHLAELARAGGDPGADLDFSAAHCYGVPQILDEEENLAVLARLVANFERHLEEPMLLDPD